MDVSIITDFDFVTDDALGSDTPIYIECKTSAGETIVLQLEQDVARALAKNISSLLSAIQKLHSPN